MGNYFGYPKKITITESQRPFSDVVVVNVSPFNSTVTATYTEKIKNVKTGEIFQDINQAFTFLEKNDYTMESYNCPDSRTKTYIFARNKEHEFYSFDINRLRNM